MTWPTLPAFNVNNFIDHFSGASLDSAKWTSVTSGSGTVTVTDSYVDLNAPANSAAFLYYKTRLDKTKSQLWLAAVSYPTPGSSGVSPRLLTLMNGASRPIADTNGNIDARTIVRYDYGNNGTNDVGNAFYWDDTGTQVFWSSTAQTWTKSLPNANNAMQNPIQSDDYYVVGLEIDGVNRRWRLIGWCQAFGVAGTWTFNQGWRLTALTDWVNWSVSRDSTNLWLGFGTPFTDDSVVHEARVEWVRYAEAPSGAQGVPRVVDAFAAAKQNLAAVHRLRHYYSYDGLTFLPRDRTTWALDLGTSGAWDARELQEPWAVFDGASTDYLFYTGTNARFVQAIGVAAAPHASPQAGPWTKSSGNPIVQIGSSGSDDDGEVGFACVVRDQTDVAYPWKMLYSGKKASDGRWRLLYATAPAAIGPWTKQGRALDVGSAGAKDQNAARDAVVLYYNGQWEVWYEGWDSNNAGHLMRATGTSLGALTKDARSPCYSPRSVDRALTANLSTAPGRVVSVASTSGLNVDEIVAFSQSSNGDTYSASRVRKVVNATTVELYHGLTGFTTTTPAKLKPASSWPNLTPRWIGLVGAQWRFYLNLWEPFTNGGDGASYSSLLEEGYLFTHLAAAPNGATPTLDYLASPVISRGFNDDQGSLENLTLVNQPFTSTSFVVSIASAIAAAVNIARQGVVGRVEPANPASTIAMSRGADRARSIGSSGVPTSPPSRLGTFTRSITGGITVATVGRAVGFLRSVSASTATKA